MIERQDGCLGKGGCLAADLWGGVTIETTAHNYALVYGARHVQATLPGELGIWDDRRRCLVPGVHATREAAEEVLYLPRFDYGTDDLDPCYVSVREFHPAVEAAR